MGSKVKHSPTPWRRTTTIEGCNTAFEGADGWWIGACSMGWPDENKSIAEANADHIVKCVNAHDRLAEENARLNDVAVNLHRSRANIIADNDWLRSLVRIAIPMVDCWRNTTADREEIRLCDEWLADARCALGEEAGDADA